MSTISILNPSSGTENSKTIEVKTDSVKAISVYPRTLLFEGTNEGDVVTIESNDPIVCGFYLNMTEAEGEDPSTTSFYVYVTEDINADPDEIAEWTDISYTVFGSESLVLKPEGYGSLPVSAVVAVPLQIPAVRYLVRTEFSGLGDASTLEIFALTTS